LRKGVERGDQAVNRNARSGQKKLTVEEWKRARKAYESGKTYPEVAGEFGVHQDTLKKQAKRGKWRLKDRTAIVREASTKARAKLVERAAKTIEKRNEELLERGGMLLDLMLGEINERAKNLAKGIGSPAEYRAIVSAYKDLVQTLRLQTGQSTHNMAGKLDTNVQVETWEQVVARMGAEKGIDGTAV
jgi:transposase-like protein